MGRGYGRQLGRSKHGALIGNLTQGGCRIPFPVHAYVEEFTIIELPPDGAIIKRSYRYVVTTIAPVRQVRGTDLASRWIHGQPLVQSVFGIVPAHADSVVPDIQQTLITLQFWR